MKLSKIAKYASAMKVIKAEDNLTNLQINNWSKFKKQTRKKITDVLKRPLRLVKTAGSGKLLSYSQVMENLQRRLGRG